VAVMVMAVVAKGAAEGGTATEEAAVEVAVAAKVA